MISTVFSARAHAADITLKWTRNTEPDIAGYKIFYGIQSQAYDNVITINDTATEPEQCQYTIYGLQEGQTYYIALKSFDLGGNESTYSQETSAYIDSSSQHHYDITDNLIINGTAEQGESTPYGWKIGDWTAQGQSKNNNPGSWSTDKAHSGSHSLKITNQTGSRVYWMGDPINFDGSLPKTLTLGGWSKAENVSSGGWAYSLLFKVVFENGSYIWYYPLQLHFNDGTHDWQHVQVTATWTKGIKQVVPYCLLYDKTGTAWFDDIYVRE